MPCAVKVLVGSISAAVCGLVSAPAAAQAPPEPSENSITLAGLVRDFLPQPLHPDFGVNLANGTVRANLVAPTMDGDSKPVFTGNGRRITREWRDAQNRPIAPCLYSGLLGDRAGNFGAADNAAITSVASFSQWFRDVPGVNMSKIWNITLTRDNNGVFVHDTNNFHPIDHELFGNGPDEHNYYFTYELMCRFIYDASAGQFFEFTGTEDVWVFINNRLVIDHGGIAGNDAQFVDFNRLGLTNGQEYELRFFMAERKQPQSQFRIRTTAALESFGTETIFAACD
jgi:fibro-slime domain-containing protein